MIEITPIVTAGIGGIVACAGTYWRGRAETKRLRADLAGRSLDSDERLQSQRHEAYRLLLDAISEVLIGRGRDTSRTLAACDRRLNEVLLVGGNEVGSAAQQLMDLLIRASRAHRMPPRRDRWRWRDPAPEVLIASAHRRLVAAMRAELGVDAPRKRKRPLRTVHS
jgi:hypothetical protein